MIEDGCSNLTPLITFLVISEVNSSCCTSSGEKVISRYRKGVSLFNILIAYCWFVSIEAIFNDTFGIMLIKGDPSSLNFHVIKYRTPLSN